MRRVVVGATPLLHVPYAGVSDPESLDLEAREFVTGCTALWAACASGCVGVALELIAAGADVDARNAHGRTPLLAAAMGDGRVKGATRVGEAPKSPSPAPPRKDAESVAVPIAGNIIVSDDSDSADIETDVDIDYSDAGTST